MDNRLGELLDKVYELEGLVHLALHRDDAPQDFIRLISKKGKEVAIVCENLINTEKSQENSQESSKIENEPFSIEEYSLDESSEDSPKHALDEEPAEYVIEDDIVFKEIKDKREDEMTYTPSKGKLIFTINEKFRFRKELFDNSDADFNNTLALVASMENFEEAEEYFINEEGFDVNQPVVREFLEIIKRYFK